MKNINSQVLRKTFAVRFILARFTLVRFVLAAILIPALLIGSAFTFGGSNLQAQANGNSKLGFFAGFVYLSGFKVDSITKTTRVTNATTNITGTTITSYDPNVTYSDITTSIEADATTFSGFSDNLKAGIKALIAANCKTGATTTDADDGTYSFARLASRLSLHSFDVGTRDEVDATHTRNNDGVAWTLDTCFDHFSSNGVTADDFADYEVTADDIIVRGSIISTTTDTDALITTTNKSDKLSGIGLQFGFRWEKWRASLTHFTGKGGANELANTLVMADYFVNKGLFIGGGLASMKLTSGSASGSATSPVLRVGYKQNLTSNLSLNFGLTKYISGVSLKSSTAPTTTPYTPDPISNPGDTTRNSLTHEQGPIKRSVVIGAAIDDPTPDNADSGAYFSSSIFDLRTQATQSGSRTVTYREIIETGATTTTTEGTIETTTETNAELKAPLVISISFHLSF